MHVYHSQLSAAHLPATFSRRGATVDHPESVERYFVFHRSLVEAGFDVREARDHGLDPILAVHSAEYVDFLSRIWDRRSEIDPPIDAAAVELTPTLFPRPQMHRRPTGLIGLLGYHMADTSTPIMAGTWTAAYGTAQAAVAAADAALRERYAYALCRPPGHHAYADCAGGFCYLNNAAIAAQRLRAGTGSRVAILDIDVHHGNGTQGIFYERSDVLTVSVHGNPSNCYPCFAGYEDEIGAGEGRGFNLNLPLPHGSADAVFLDAVHAALARIEEFAPAALVISLGLDASEDDPIGVLKVTREGFVKAARAAARMQIPTVIVQEGGYLCPALPLNLIAFLRALGA
jgi:acetoin utilization deacetylase AcuC-like enzyme